MLPTLAPPIAATLAQPGPLAATAVPYEVYKIVHLVGLVLLMLGLGAAVAHGVLSGGDKSAPFRKVAVISHGVGLVLMLVAGFGLLAALGIPGFPWPTWVFIKFGVWLLMGGLISVALRKPGAAKPLWAVIVLLAAVAAAVAVYKPG